MSYIERSNTPTYTGGSNVNNASQRPYSVNNPFRNASTDSSINQYKSDLEFQNWVRENQQAQFGSAPQGQSFYSRPSGNRSTGSFRSYHSNTSRNSGAFYEEDIIDHYKRSDSPVHKMAPPPSAPVSAGTHNGFPAVQRNRVQSRIYDGLIAFQVL
ncbi:hypothetical protein ACO0QE_000663 [Hanseniaspora vineae]